MKKFNLIAGIDISKDTLDVQWRRTDDSEPAKHQTFANSAKGIQSMFSLLDEFESEQSEILICCEHTGVYMDRLSACIQSTSITFWPMHPLVIKNYQIDMQRIKNDKVDAGKILEFATNHQHKAVHYKHKDWHTSQIRDLFRLKKQLVRIQTQIKNFQHAHKLQTYASSTATLIYGQLKDLIGQYIKQCEKEIKSLIKQVPEIDNFYKILKSIPGIGPVTAVHFITVSNCFEKLDNYKSFACFIGIAPFEHYSGSSIRKRPRTSKMTVKIVKADMHQAAVSVIRKGQLFFDYYQKMKMLNKHHNWIVNSIINKISKLAFDLIKKREFFNKDVYLSNKESFKNNLQVS